VRESGASSRMVYRSAFERSASWVDGNIGRQITPTARRA
jgi:hypothetical protein